MTKNTLTVYVVTLAESHDYTSDTVREHRAFSTYAKAEAFANSLGWFSDNHPSYPFFNKEGEYGSTLTIEKMLVE